MLNGWRSNVVSLGQFSLPGWSWCNSFFFSFLGLFRFLFDSLTDAFLFSLSLLALVADGITFMLGRDVFFPRRVDRTHRNSWTGRQLARSTKFVVFFFFPTIVWFSWKENNKNDGNLTWKRSCCVGLFSLWIWSIDFYQFEFLKKLNLNFIRILKIRILIKF